MLRNLWIAPNLKELLHFQENDEMLSTERSTERSTQIQSSRTSTADSKFDIKKEILEDENVATPQVTENNKLPTKVTEKSAKPQKLKHSDNFDQFWILVRPRVISNLSLWTFLTDKVRLSSTSTSEVQHEKDVEKLNFLLSEVEHLLEEVSNFLKACCHSTDEAEEGFVSKVICDLQNGRQLRSKVRLKVRKLMPTKYRQKIFAEVPSVEAEDLNEVSRY